MKLTGDLPKMGLIQKCVALNIYILLRISKKHR
jgi:hypothetical protein